MPDMTNEAPSLTPGALIERFVISSDPHLQDRDAMHRWLSEESYWAAGCARDVTDRAIDSSLVYGVFDAQGYQLAMGRAVTDRATFAWVCDVFVDEAHRGMGIGTWITETIVSHLRDLGVQRLMLGTRDAHGVYARVGFKPVAAPQRFMEIDERPTAAAIVAFLSGANPSNQAAN